MMQPTRGLNEKTLHWLLAVAMTCALGGIAAFFVDLRVAQAMTRGFLPGDIYALVQLSEVFAHGCGAFFILLTVWVLDPQRRRAMYRLLGTVLLPVAAVHLCKLVVVRARPRTFGIDGVLEFPESVWDTFQVFSVSAMAESDLQSWPSGHTATAVGLAVGLSWLYPRGWWLFATFATLAALQRVSVNAHFLSDTLFAAAISLCAVQFCHRNTWLARWYDRLENPTTDTCPGHPSPQSAT